MATPKDKPRKSARTLAEFSAAYNKDEIVPRKIREGLKQIGEGWETEVNFLKIASLSTTDFANYREQFEEYMVIIQRTKRVWAGTPEFAQKMREMVL